jgi:small subunit ribosomal protein S6
MNSYEHTIIIRQDLSENQVKKLLDKYKNIINGNSGKILKTESWGLRNLSYEIKSNKKGLYFHIKLEGDGKTIQELEREENIDQMLLRFLTIKVKKIDLNVNYFEKKE